MSQDPLPVLITRQVEYFEVAVFAFCSLYGTTALIKYQDLASQSVKNYPGVGGIVFLALLVVGGATGLVSYAFKTIIGPKLELAGLTLLVTLCIAYSLWTIFSGGTIGLGLLLSMAVLIAVPGYFTRRRLVRFISSVESVQENHDTRRRETRTSDSAAMGDSRDWRWWWR